MYALYSIGFSLFFLALLPAFLLQAWYRGKYRRGIGERMGRYPADLLRSSTPRRPVWIHAVSVGEVGAARPLVMLLREKHPEVPLVLSTVTETGRQVVERTLREIPVIFFPLDFPWAVRRALETLSPRLVLLTETEIWPNFLRACEIRGIPVVVVNGRISRRSYRRYRLVRPFLRRVLRGVSLVCMQSQADAERVTELGAPPERVRVTGNLKFDDLAVLTPATDIERWRRELSLSARHTLWVAGSTHPGEETEILTAFQALRPAFPHLVLLLAPRHPERVGEVESLVLSRGLRPLRRTALAASGTREGDVLLLDTVGELSRIYAAATLVFVGGTLIPVGGHNILEPAVYGKPILCGPSMENFQEIRDLFVAENALCEVKGASAMIRVVTNLLENPSEAERLGRAAREVVERSRGAALRTFAALEQYL